MRPALAAVVACLILAAPAAAALDGQNAATRLSQQREAQGIPGGITESSLWTSRCGAHVAWELQNNVQSHPEAPGSPGYSDEGNLGGTSAVLGPPWTGGEYMAGAPWHYLQIMDPRLAEIGYAENQRFSCMTTWPGFTRPGPAQVTLYGIPAEGRTAPWWESSAGESPYNPLDTLGLPHDTLSGPIMYVYVDGPWATYQDVKSHIASATLTGPDGPVQVLTVDSTTVNPSAPPIMSTDTGLVIPRFPLRPNSTYTASVTLAVDAAENSGSYTKTWTFKTAAADKAADAMLGSDQRLCRPVTGADAECHKASRKDLLDLGLLAELKVGKVKHSKSKLLVPLSASSALVGKPAKVMLRMVTFRGSKKLKGMTLTLKSKQTLKLPAPPRGGFIQMVVDAGAAGVVRSFR